AAPDLVTRWVRPEDHELDQAVVEEDALPGSAVAREVLVARADPTGVEGRLVVGGPREDRDLLAGHEIDLAVRELGGADLRAAEVLEHRHRPRQLDLELADPPEDLVVVVVRAVREV